VYHEEISSSHVHRYLVAVAFRINGFLQLLALGRRRVRITEVFMKGACVLNNVKRVATIGYQVGQFKSNFVHVVADARRAARNGWRGAEDLAEEVTFAVKRQPLKSMGLTFVAAFGIGTLVTWVATRK
jgi:hypothetical protein